MSENPVREEDHAAAYEYDVPQTYNGPVTFNGVVTFNGGTVGLTIAVGDVGPVNVSKLLGRGSAAGAGPAQEITLGAGLSMTGTTLAATGGGTTPGGAVETVQFNDSGTFGGIANSSVYSNGGVAFNAIYPAGPDSNISLQAIVGGSAATLNTNCVDGSASIDLEALNGFTGRSIVIRTDDTDGIFSSAHSLSPPESLIAVSNLVTEDSSGVRVNPTKTDVQTDDSLHSNVLTIKSQSVEVSFDVVLHTKLTETRLSTLAPVTAQGHVQTFATGTGVPVPIFTVDIGNLVSSSGTVTFEVYLNDGLDVAAFHGRFAFTVVAAGTSMYSSGASIGLSSSAASDLGGPVTIAATVTIDISVPNFATMNIVPAWTNIAPSVQKIYWNYESANPAAPVVVIL